MSESFGSYMCAGAGLKKSMPPPLPWSRLTKTRIMRRPRSFRCRREKTRRVARSQRWMPRPWRRRPGAAFRQTRREQPPLHAAAPERARSLSLEKDAAAATTHS
ncbi:hypothetical protein DAI22_03g048066 [Oryza sativa Japonica Group]|nr:hypothetical protein DAI22_03g048066 [Oryza sativa Japonica Group]